MKTDKNIQSLRDLHGQLLQYKGGFILIVVIQILWAFIELLFPFLTQALVDQGVQQQDLHFVYLVLIGQLVLFLGSITADYFKMWMVRNIGVRLNMQLINNYLKQILKKPLLFFNEHPYGVILQNLNDNFRIERFLTDSYVNLFNAVFRLLMFGIVLYIFDAKAGFILLIAVIIFFGWNFVFWRQREIEDKRLFATRTAIRSNLLQIVNGIYDIKLNNQERIKLEEWYDSQDILSNTRLMQLKYWQYYFGGVAFINQLRDIFILFFTALAVMKGTLTLGAMIAIQYILGRLNQPMTDIMQFVQDYQDASLSFERLSKFTLTTPEDYLPSEESVITSLQLPIDVNAVSFNYKDTPAVKQANLNVPYGTNVAIVGESGSGKSTFLKLLLKLLTPNEGKIKVGNRKLADIDTSNWRSNCSVVSQEGFIFDETIRYNITLQRSDNAINDDQLYKAIELACMEKIIDDLEQGIHTPLGKAGKTLSKGQGQRVLLARAYYKNANYLFMDEPTSALDNITAMQVIQNLKTYYEDRTVIIVTHKVSIAEKMDYIMLMDAGVIVERGTHEELLALDGAYAALYNS